MILTCGLEVWKQYLYNPFRNPLQNPYTHIETPMIPLKTTFFAFLELQGLGFGVQEPRWSTCLDPCKGGFPSNWEGFTL